MNLLTIGWFQNIALFLALVGFSTLATWCCRDYLRVMDVANHRSSHVGSVPRSGGVAILLTLFLGVLVYYLGRRSYFVAQETFWGLLLSALIIALVSFYDDITNKAILFKFLSQLAGVVILMSFGLTINELTIPFYGKVSLGWFSYPLTIIWVVGITNAFNFMDGLNGLAAGTAAIIAIAFSFIALGMGSKFVFHVSYFLAAGCIGFLFFNYPRASIFMGDVGSTLLGFMFGSMAILAANYDYSHTPFLVIPILLANFIMETLLTFLWRLWKRQKVLKPHRLHPFQLLHRMGMRARQVTLLYFLQSLLLVGAYLLYAYFLSHKNPWMALGSLAGILVAYSIYFLLVYRAAQRRGFLHMSKAVSAPNRNLEEQSGRSKGLWQPRVSTAESQCGVVVQ